MPRTARARIRGPNTSGQNGPGSRENKAGRPRMPMATSSTSSRQTTATQGTRLSRKRPSSGPVLQRPGRRHGRRSAETGGQPALHHPDLDGARALGQVSVHDRAHSLKAAPHLRAPTVGAEGDHGPEAAQQRRGRAGGSHAAGRSEERRARGKSAPLTQCPPGERQPASAKLFWNLPMKVRVFTLLLERETANFDDSALLTFRGNDPRTPRGHARPSGPTGRRDRRPSAVDASG